MKITFSAYNSFNLNSVFEHKKKTLQKENLKNELDNELVFQNIKKGMLMCRKKIMNYLLIY